MYGYLAAIIGRVFFVSSSSAVQIIASPATFSIAFLRSPFGGVICGLLGDRRGRKSGLDAILFVVASATFAIGLVADYATIGELARALLVALRLLQGLSAGGEVSAAAIFVAARCDDRHRTLMTARAEVSAMAGFLLGALTSYVLHRFFNDAQLISCAWRIPFFLAAPLTLIGLYIGQKLEESPLFIETPREGKIGHSSMAARFATWGRIKLQCYRPPGW